ncbi:MAG TPA: hypothetical protein VD906_08845, partial [Caulobacteraceae bacterium]|nr:hypothetical protein [Caulobacteraceae bacterium]
PTGDEGEGLSTGETDFAVATDVSYPLGAWTPFVTLGYRLRGDPEGIDLDNTLYTSLGATYAVSDSSVLTFSYDYAQASTDFVEDSHELFAGYTAPLVGRVNWTLYGLAGLSEGSPDITAGVQLSAPFS